MTYSVTYSAWFFEGSWHIRPPYWYREDSPAQYTASPDKAERDTAALWGVPLALDAAKRRTK